MSPIIEAAPYHFSSEELYKIINYFENNWKKCPKPLKKKIRDHLYDAQQRVCPYCFCNFNPHCSNMFLEIDHVVPWKKHRRFTFEEYNLVLSCGVCNRAKLQNETLFDPDTPSYPHDSSGFLIVHPFFDEFDQHLGWSSDTNGLTLRGITPKGKNTILFCNANREYLLKLRSESRYFSIMSRGKRLVYKLIREMDSSDLQSVLEIIQRLQ